MTDLLTLDEAKRAIGQTNSNLDADLERLITSVTTRVEKLCGPVVYQTITDEMHTGGVCAVRPRYTPVASISSVIEATGTTTTTLTADSWSTLNAAGYYFDPTTQFIWRRSSGLDTPFAPRVKLTYQAGRCEDTDSVPTHFKDAAGIILNHIWSAEHGAGSDSFGVNGVTSYGPSFAIPNRALELLAADRLLPGIA